MLEHVNYKKKCGAVINSAKIIKFIENEEFSWILVYKWYFCFPNII